jgi:hypothetical protein
MTAAVVGVVSVIAGALLGGVLNYQLARSRQRALARAARRRIAAELKLVADRLKSAADTGKWWSGALPSDTWKATVNDLAVEVKRDLIDELTDAYALVELWNSDCAEHGRPGGEIDARLLRNRPKTLV